MQKLNSAFSMIFLDGKEVASEGVFAPQASASASSATTALRQS
jgi:hypothetical protein